MKKRVFGRQFKRDANERKALFRGLINSLVMYEKIETTTEKAKAIRGQAEKLVTKAKRRGGESRQFLQPYLSSDAVEKVIDDLSVRFAQRSGGYTRIVKTGRRFADGASMAVIEWVEKSIKAEVVLSQAVSQITEPEVIEEVRVEAPVEEKKETILKKTLKSAKRTDDKKLAKTKKADKKKV